jgi:hypothetical protein
MRHDDDMAAGDPPTVEGFASAATSDGRFA